MFIDYLHKNKLIIKNNKKFLVKYLDNREILDKEFNVLNFLKNETFIPKVLDYKKQTFLEEFLDVESLKKKDLSESNIKEIAFVLNRLHSLKISKQISKFIENDFLVNEKYYPSKVFQEMVKHSSWLLGKNLYKRIESIMKTMDNYFNSKPYSIGLIHGDLSFQNILIGDRIYIIDWTDCRQDIASCDVAQLFYLLKFNSRQEKVFLRHYDIGYIDEKILLTHKILLLIYDLIDFYKKNSKLNKGIRQKLIKSIHEENLF